MRNHKPVPDGTLVRLKEWGDYGTVKASVDAGQPNATYWVHSGMVGDKWVSRSEFTIPKG